MPEKEQKEQPRERPQQPREQPRVIERVIERVVVRTVKVPADPWSREDPIVRDPLADYDRIGRKQPHNIFTPMHIARMYPAFLRPYTKKVPVERVERRIEEGKRLAVFVCVCEHGHETEANSVTRCDCGRWFFDNGRDVLVAREPEAAEAEEGETPVVD